MEIFLVGGAVRDALLNLPVNERDWVVVGAEPKDLLNRGYKPVGKDFPVFLHPTSGEEYALARTERKTGKGYHGFECYSAKDVTLSDDLKRRDLTINAIAQATNGTLIDPYNGKADIDAKLLRHVSESFIEDPVRILRIARFAARFQPLGFRIAADTMTLMKKMVANGEVDNLVAERVWKEMSRALSEPNPAEFFITLKQCGALQRILPELDGLLKTDEAGYLSRLIRASSFSPKPAVRFAALFHHIAEPGDSQVIEQLCQRLAIPNYFRELTLLVANFKLCCHRVQTLDAEQLLDCFEKMDAFRRPERIDDFLLCCAAHAEQINQTPNYPQALFFQRALDCCSAITAAMVDTRRFHGKAIGDEIHRLRLQVIQDEILKS